MPSPCAMLRPPCAQGGTDMGSIVTGGDDAGMVLRATHAILRALSIVPKAKYCLSVAYCGLTVGHEAQLFDLLAPAPAAAAVSLRDGSAAAALAGLTAWAVEDPVDVLEVRVGCRTAAAGAGGMRVGSCKRNPPVMIPAAGAVAASRTCDATRLQLYSQLCIKMPAMQPTCCTVPHQPCKFAVCCVLRWRWVLRLCPLAVAVSVCSVCVSAGPEEPAAAVHLGRWWAQECQAQQHAQHAHAAAGQL